MKGKESNEYFCILYTNITALTVETFYINFFFLVLWYLIPLCFIAKSQAMKRVNFMSSLKLKWVSNLMTNSAFCERESANRTQQSEIDDEKLRFYICMYILGRNILRFAVLFIFRFSPFRCR